MKASPSPSVVVTGMGAVSPFGVGTRALLDGLAAGRSSARPITRFDASAHPVRFAGEVPDFEPGRYLPRKLLAQLDPFAAYALVAAEEALAQAGLLAEDRREPDGAVPLTLPVRADVDAHRIGTLIASSAGGMGEITKQHARLLDGGPRRVRPFLTIAQPSNMGCGQVAIRHRLRGPAFAVNSACASGTDSIGLALDLLRAGRADVVVAGGAEAAVNELIVAAFAAAGALSTRNDEPERASRPFDAGRDGFVIGEGAGVLVLERAEHAAARGAHALAEVAGYAATDDAFHPTAPRPDGEGAAAALRLALADAGAAPAEVGHVNAHGTSTPINDRTEALAVRAVFGGLADDLPVTSTKGATGHLLGAAGAVEAIATVAALTDGVIPPTANLERLDPDVDLDVVAGAPRKVDIALACSNSFGFGGHNSVLVLRRIGA